MKYLNMSCIYREIVLRGYKNMKIHTHIKKLTGLFLMTILFVSADSAVPVKFEELTSAVHIDGEDLDPLVDIEVTVEIQKIRAFDKEDKQFSILPNNPLHFKREYIDKESDPDFYVKIFINEQEFASDIWHDRKYIYNPQFSATLNVPDDEEFVTVKIQLWDWNENGDVLCDIGDENDDAELTYSIKNGHWTGEDFLGDSSGYGRLNGCDDGTIYKRDRDCELWFDIYQNDYDGDGIPYWTEVNDYGTDPEFNNWGEDSDSDDIPIEWEWKWGYNPIVWEDHKEIDPEMDSINNFEEYLTSEWFSDPFRKDVFVELDMMDEGPNGEKTYFPANSEEIISTAFNRQNIVFHLDYGSMGGYEIIPFTEIVDRRNLREIYNDFFLHGDENNWRRDVFHYGVVVYRSESAAGYVFRPNAFQISSFGHEVVSEEPWADRDVVYASAYMHELGHTFDFDPIPGHTRYGGLIGWLINRPYKSCMNYGYMYYTVDYSDGSRRSPDLDDWSRMDLTFFERDWH